MTATDELRRLLDGRGVEWTASDGMYVKETCWPYFGELMAAFAEYDNGETRFACDTWCFTPEQAIEATLGRGGCEFCKDGKFDRQTVMMSNHGWQRINFCPNCGRSLKS